MRCYICDFNPTQPGTDPTNNHVFEHKGKEICQVCFDSIKEALAEFDEEEDKPNDQT